MPGMGTFQPSALSLKVPVPQHLPGLQLLMQLSNS